MLRVKCSDHAKIGRQILIIYGNSLMSGFRNFTIGIEIISSSLTGYVNYEY